MKIRIGNYTIYNGSLCQLFEQRYESPIPQNEMLYQICYNSVDKFDFIGFEKHPSEELYCKSFLLAELKDAFSINTFGLYKGIKVKVFGFRPNPKLIHITSMDKKALGELSFIDMGDYYLKEIKLTDLEKLWEERSHSEYNLPMPEGLKEYEELKI